MKKNKQKFNLSEKAECDNMSSFHKASLCPNHEDCHLIYNEEDVKEFIKRLKEEIHNKGRYEETEVLYIIDKLAGDKLVEAKE